MLTEAAFWGAMGMLLSGVLGAIMLIPDGLPRIDANNYAESMQERKIAARIILTWPLWGWFTVPLTAIAAVVWFGAFVFCGARPLWRAAFPGNPPSDGAGPSQGAYR